MTTLSRLRLPEYMRFIYYTENVNRKKSESPNASTLIMIMTMTMMMMVMVFYHVSSLIAIIQPVASHKIG